jgi:hypothetical protein
MRRSVTASAFTASLELAREGVLERRLRWQWWTIVAHARRCLGNGLIPKISQRRHGVVPPGGLPIALFQHSVPVAIPRGPMVRQDHVEQLRHRLAPRTETIRIHDLGKPLIQAFDWAAPQ